jgi:hypothetical protein
MRGGASDRAVAFFSVRGTIVRVMNGIEIETNEGWRRAPAHVVSLGGGRFRASVRLRAQSSLTDTNVRFEGRPVRGLVKAIPQSSPALRACRDTVVIEFRTG